MRPDEQQAHDERRHREIIQRLEALIDAVLGTNDRWDKRLPKPPIDEPKWISNEEIILRTYGRKHTLLLCGSAVTVDLHTSIGTISLNCNAGWNILDLPDGTPLTTSGTPQNVLLRATDEVAPGLF